MKGQIFVITSVLILLVLFTVRVTTQTPVVEQYDAFHDSFSNLKTELVKTVDLALLNKDNVTDRLDDFIYFSKDVLRNKGYVESVNYSVSQGVSTTVYLNVSLSSNNDYLLESLIINRTVYS